MSWVLPWPAPETSTLTSRTCTPGEEFTGLRESLLLIARIAICKPVHFYTPAYNHLIFLQCIIYERDSKISLYSVGMHANSYCTVLIITREL